MTASATMTIRISPDVKERPDRLETHARCCRSFLAGAAVVAYYGERALEINKGIHRGDLPMWTPVVWRLTMRRLMQRRAVNPDAV